MESRVLEALAKCASSLKADHISLQFDGADIRLNPFPDCFKNEAKSYIEKETGFSVNLVRKEHLFFCDFLTRVAVEVLDCPFEIESPKWLLPGNCIPAAIARIFAGSPTTAEILETLDQMPPIWYGSRTYRECVASLPSEFTLAPKENFELAPNRKYLIRAGGFPATPHCFAAISGGWGYLGVQRMRLLRGNS